MTATTTTPSLYQQVLGADFARLDPAVRRFHRLAGHHLLHGWVETTAPRSLPARLLARCLGSPVQGGSGPFRFELRAAPGHETWTRFFPSKTMRSTLRLRHREIVESLGPARVIFRMAVSGNRLAMGLGRLYFLGIRCPAFLAPRIEAEEWGADDRLFFRIEASVPWVGVVARYSGHLDMPAEQPA